MTLVLQVFHGSASTRHVVFETWPTRLHANLAVVWLDGFAGCFVIRTASVERDGLPAGCAKTDAGASNAAAAAKAADAASMRGRNLGTVG